jgi:DNA-binding beta-propeller fold protein YncE
VAIDPDGAVAVSDAGNARVVFLRHDGKGLQPLRAVGGFSEPTGVAADGIGGFYVCDRGLGTVFHVDANGRKSTFGLEVAFDRPIAVATIPEGDRLARGKKRALVIVDVDGERLRTFDVGGALGATRNASELGVGAAHFDDVDIDYYGNIFAVDRANHRVHKFRQDLYPLDTFGGLGTQVGQFVAPRGIAIHRPLGQVFVTEEDGGQYLWIGTEIRNLQVDRTPGGIALSFLLTEDSSVELDVLDARGRTVARILDGPVRRAGPQDGTWDGSDSSGARVGPGTYVARLRARATYASRSTYTCEATETFRLEAGGGR